MYSPHRKCHTNTVPRQWHGQDSCFQVKTSLCMRSIRRKQETIWKMCETVIAVDKVVEIHRASRKPTRCTKSKRWTLSCLQMEATRGPATTPCQRMLICRMARICPPEERVKRLEQKAVKSGCISTLTHSTSQLSRISHRSSSSLDLSCKVLLSLRRIAIK